MDQNRKKLLLFLLLAVHGCGADTVSIGDRPGGGIGGTGVVAAKGPITGFGSIFVNGIEFHTERAAIRIEGSVASEDKLRIGMVVLVNGTIDPGGSTGTAETVDYAKDVKGPVESIDSAGKVLRVLGQKVLIEADTHVVGVPNVGNVVEVSGLIDADGAIRATYVEKKADELEPGSEIEIKGPVTGLDLTDKTFQINGQVVSWAVADLGKLPGGRPQAGQFVKVWSTQSYSSGVLLASSIEIEHGSGMPSEGGTAALEGFVTSVGSGRYFSVNGTPVDASTARIEHGRPGDIAVNVRVEVKGTWNDGILVAEKIEIEGQEEESERR